MDDRIDEFGVIVPVDDIAVIKGIKHSGLYDDLTGFALIDDDTLPEWLCVKRKRDTKEWNKGDLVYSPNGNPFLSTKTMISLLMGAMRQEDNKVEEMIKRIEMLETA